MSVVFGVGVAVGRTITLTLAPTLTRNPLACGGEGHLGPARPQRLVGEPRRARRAGGQVVLVLGGDAHRLVRGPLPP